MVGSCSFEWMVGICSFEWMGGICSFEWMGGICPFEWMGGICPFEWMVGGQAKENRSDGLFLHQSADNEMLIYAQVNSAFVTLLCTKIASSPPILKGGESALLRI